MTYLILQMKPRIKLILYIFFLLACFIDSSFGNEILIIADGSAKTSKEALLAAKRSAVEKGIGSIIFSRREVDNFMLRRETIISNTMGAIKKVDVLKESQTADGLVYIKIKAIVCRESISNDLNALGILMESMDKPRVMVMVSEGFSDQKIDICQTALIKKLKDKQFNIIDPAAAAYLMEKDKKFVGEITSGKTATAIEFATNHGAEVIIIANVTTSFGPKMFDMYSGQAEIFLQAVLCSNGEVISSKSAHDAAAHISKPTAIANAVQGAVSKLFVKPQSPQERASFLDDIVGFWQNQQNNGIAIRLTVERVQNEKSCQDIRRLIESLDDDIVNIISRSWRENRCDLDVLYKGETDTLSNKLDNLESFSTVSRSAGRIVVKSTANLSTKR